jgi:hypothetical protein
MILLSLLAVMLGCTRLFSVDEMSSTEDYPPAF